MARKKIIAGNWKMNMTPSEAVELVNTLNRAHFPNHAPFQGALIPSPHLRSRRPS